jgi:hypothetical protein
MKGLNGNSDTSNPMNEARNIKEGLEDKSRGGNRI